MFAKFKRWWNPRRDFSPHDVRVLQRWSQQHGHVLRQVRATAEHGVVVEWPAGDLRLEWGPSQRSYLGGAQELRWKATGIRGGEQPMLCLTKALAKRLEADMFQQLTQENQTLVDDSLPDEMRWLLMLPRIEGAVVSEYLMLSQSECWVQLWQDPAFRSALIDASDWWADQYPCVMTYNRGCLTLRMPGHQLSTARLDAMMQLFTVTVERVRAATLP